MDDDVMKDNLARQQAAYAKLHNGEPMPHSMVKHAVTQMFALQSLLFEDAIDESDALPKLYDVEYWHTLVPESSTDPDGLCIALLSRVKEDNGNNVASVSTLTPSSSVVSDDNAVVRSLLREEGYCILPPANVAASTAVSKLCKELVRIQTSLQAEGLPPQFIYVYNAPWQLLAEHWTGPATAALGEDSILEADMNCWVLRRMSTTSTVEVPYIGANFAASHRDQIYSACHDDDGECTSVNLWTPYNVGGATSDNGAMRVLPCTSDDFFYCPDHPLHLQTSASLESEGAAEAVVTLTCASGDACLWSPSLIHWGGSCNADATDEPRQSLAATFRSASAPRSQFGGGDNSTAGPGPMILADLNDLTLQRRLAYVAKGLLAYSHHFPGFPGLTLAK
jgi:hypothetical protein